MFKTMFLTGLTLSALIGSYPAGATTKAKRTFTTTREFRDSMDRMEAGPMDGWVVRSAVEMDRGRCRYLGGPKSPTQC